MINKSVFFLFISLFYTTLLPFSLTSMGVFAQAESTYYAQGSTVLKGTSAIVNLTNGAAKEGVTKGEKRFALVIGEYHYQNASDLYNQSYNDSKVISDNLLSNGFDVVKLEDVTKKGFDTILPAIKTYYQNNGYNIAVIYFGGHGSSYQFGDKRELQLLFPIDSKSFTIEQPTEAQFQNYLFLNTILVGELMQTFNLKQTNYCLSIINACRANGFDFKLVNPYSLWNKDKEWQTMGGKGSVIFASSKSESAYNGGLSTYGLYPFTSLFVAYFSKLFKVGNNESTYSGDPKTICRILANRIPDEQPEIKLPANGYHFSFFKYNNNFGIEKILPESVQSVLDIMKSVSTRLDAYLGNMYVSDTSIRERDNERPPHSVALDPYYISMYEITVDKFEAFVNATHYLTDAEKSGFSWIYYNNFWVKVNDVFWRHNLNGRVWSAMQKRTHAVVHVSWNDANAYCAWLSSVTGKKFRLPTEAEWEVAAGGDLIHGDGYRYCGSDVIGDVANYNKQHDVDVGAIGKRQSNWLGLFDMSGNVWEWCLDTYDPNYYSDLNKGVVDQKNPKGPQRNGTKVIKGGSVVNDAGACRITARASNPPDYHDGSGGFRVIMED